MRMHGCVHAQHLWVPMLVLLVERQLGQELSGRLYEQCKTDNQRMAGRLSNNGRGILLGIPKGGNQAGRHKKGSSSEPQSVSSCRL